MYEDTPDTSRVGRETEIISQRRHRLRTEISLNILGVTFSCFGRTDPRTSYDATMPYYNCTLGLRLIRALGIECFNDEAKLPSAYRAERNTY